MRASLRTLTTAVIACAGLGGAYALGASGGGSGSPVTPESSFVPTSPVAAVNTSLSGPLTSAADCDEAAGATRVKRLRDALGNQLVSELLVKTIARRGYVLSVGKDTIRML